MNAREFLEDLRRDGLLQATPLQRDDGAFDVVLVLDSGFASQSDAEDVAEVVTEELRQMIAESVAVSPAKARLMRYPVGEL